MYFLRFFYVLIHGANEFQILVCLRYLHFFISFGRAYEVNISTNVIWMRLLHSAPF